MGSIKFPECPNCHETGLEEVGADHDAAVLWCPRCGTVAGTEQREHRKIASFRVPECSDDKGPV